MSPNLLTSVILIVSALVCYSIGVWSEKLQNRLKPWHLLFFWAGFVCDTLGTSLMTQMAGGMALNAHGITGALAIILMAVHAVWATIVLVMKKEEALRSFHKFSLLVWFVWLVPFVSGMVMAMGAR
ncbi:MAG: TIGR03987 family protein [Thermoflexales bacterium]|nr:TIGR03987 family protein [Thermoflexales bacterium]